MPDDLARLQQRLDELEAYRVLAAVDLAPLSFAAHGMPPTELPVGAPWPAPEAVPARLAVTVTVPPSWTHGRIVAHLDVGGEGLLRVGGQPLGGVDPNHREHDLSGHAAAGATLELVVDAVPYGPFGRARRPPVLGTARLVLIDPATEATWQRLRWTLEAARTLDGDRPDLADRLAWLLQDALAACPLPRHDGGDYRARIQATFRTAATPDGGDLAHLWEHWAAAPPVAPRSPLDPAVLARADAVLARGLDALRTEHPPEGRLHVVGHTHIDLAWLWPIAETRRKVQRSFATALTLLEADERFVFAQASPQLYALIEEDAPATFEAIRSRVAEGRWELLGGTWVEPDGNLPSGEAWARQLLFGQRYYQQRFGRRARIAWLPDTFGYAGNLPQLFRDAGLSAFFTTKLSWNDTNPFPYDLYWWEGLDGSRILTHSFHNPYGGYNGPATAASLRATWRNHRAKRHHRTALYAAGYGDGGGGPTPAMLDRLRTYRDFPGLPRVTVGRVEAFFDAIERREELPVWHGEQYLEYHRGTYTSQARTKALNRRVETVLPEAEAAATLAWRLTGRPYPRERLRDAWTQLLRNQFHDILPGSSIHTVHREAEGELGQALAEADEVRREALAALSRRIAPDTAGREALVAWNLALHDRPLELEVDLESDAPVGVYDEAGHPVPHQREGTRMILASPERPVPGLGYRTLYLGEPATELRPQTPVSASATQLENDHLRVRIGGDGTLHSVWDAGAGREVLADRGNQIWVHPDVPANFDAWEVDAGYGREGEELTAVAPPELVRAGPVEGAVRVRRRYGSSVIEQTYRLRAGSRRLEIGTRVDWRARRTLLRARVPLAVRSHEAWFDTAFGAVPRPTHANTPWDAARFEVPGHRWADLAEGDYGVSLLSDAKYGYSARGGTLGLTLLRSPVHPDPHADAGEHAFTYALWPHAGDWRHGTVREAHALNAPMPCLRVRPDPAATGPAVRRLLSLAGGGLTLSALKLHEDADRIVARFAEPHGTRGTAALYGDLTPRMKTRTSVLEEPRADAHAGTDLAYGPFEVLTAELDLGPAEEG